MMLFGLDGLPMVAASRCAATYNSCLEIGEFSRECQRPPYGLPYNESNEDGLCGW